MIQRLELLALHIVNSFPAHILIAGCDFYLPLTLQLVLDTEEMSTLSEELLSHEDDVLLMHNHPECVASLQTFEKNAKALKNRNPYDYEDESLFGVAKMDDY